MKKAYKVFSIVMMVLMIACICTNVFAVIDPNGIVPGDTEADDTMLNIGNKILGFITNAAMILAVVVIAVLGVKYMMGSTEEKSEYKKSLLPYVIGAVLVFGAGAIGRMIIGFGNSITGQ